MKNALQRRNEGIDFSACQLESLPDAIGHLPKLELLNIRGNRLETLPGSMTELKKLWWMDVRGNPLPLRPELFEEYEKPMKIIRYCLKHSPRDRGRN